MQIQPPPASPGLNGVTTDVALLFERAFSKYGSEPNGRPRPDEWVRALRHLEQHLKTCGVNPAHQFVDTLSNCPWCEIEAKVGIPLFLAPITGSTSTGFTIEAFWAKVISLPNPGPAPALPGVHGLTFSLSPAVVDIQQAVSNAKLAPGKLTLVGASGRIQSLQAELVTRAAAARHRWENLRDNWPSYASSEDFEVLLYYLKDLRNRYDALPQKRLQELSKLEANRQTLQLQAYLNRCLISRAKIRGVGAAKKAMLQSYGIETAADIVDHRVSTVPGFGPVLLSNLKHWRDQQQRRFVFDPNKGIDQAAKNTIERQILTEKIDLERRLNEGLSKLIASSLHIRTRRRALLAQAEQAARGLAQVQADLQAAKQAAQELAQVETDLRAAEQLEQEKAQEASLRPAPPVPPILSPTQTKKEFFSKENRYRNCCPRRDLHRRSDRRVNAG